MIGVTTRINVRVWGAKKLGAENALKLRTAAKELWDMVERRVRKTGTDHKGRKFPPYSDTWPNKVWHGGKKKIGRKRRRGFLVPRRGNARFPAPRGGANAGKYYQYFDNYRDYRKKLGKATNALRFDLTGKMWRQRESIVRLTRKRGPVIIMRFKGSMSGEQVGNQDWERQMRKNRMTKKRVRKTKVNPFTGGKVKVDMGEKEYQRSPRPASSAVKAAAQWQYGYGSPQFKWFKLSKKEHAYFTKTYSKYVKDAILKNVAYIWYRQGKHAGVKRG